MTSDEPLASSSCDRRLARASAILARSLPLDQWTRQRPRTPAEITAYRENLIALLQVVNEDGHNFDSGAYFRDSATGEWQLRRTCQDCGFRR